MKIKSRYGDDHGSFKENLYFSLAHNFDEFKHGVEILATTYGIRNYVEKDENIFPTALSIMGIPFWLFLFALFYDYIFNIRGKPCYIKGKESPGCIVDEANKQKTD